jgi:hypothetical protein
MKEVNNTPIQITFVEDVYSHEDVLAYKEGETLSIRTSSAEHLCEASHHTLEVLKHEGNIVHKVTIENSMIKKINL